MPRINMDFTVPKWHKKLLSHLIIPDTSMGIPFLACLVGVYLSTLALPQGGLRSDRIEKNRLDHYAVTVLNFVHYDVMLTPQ